MLGKLLHQLLKRKPDGSLVAARLQEGYAALGAEHFESARTIAAETLALAPRSFGAHVLMAQSCASLGDPTLALSNAAAAIALQPANPEGYYVRALIHEAGGQIVAALADYARVLELDDRNEAALDKKGALHDARGEFDASLACAEQLVQIASGKAEAHHKLAITLRELGRLSDAEQALRQAIGISPRFDTARAHLALILIELGRVKEADQLLTSLLVDAPDQQEARWAAAVLHLLHGRYDIGWTYYEARESGQDPKLRLSNVPDWNGEPIVEGALMINAEQGLGDQIMFASCLPDVLAAASECVVSCDARLQPIFERSFPGLRVIAMHADRTPDDAELPIQVRTQTMLGSLPGRYRRGVDRFPQHAGYLRADTDAVIVWRAQLHALGPGLKVGVAWTGGTAKTRRTLRSLQLEQLLPILSAPDCRFVSLQYMDSHEEIMRLHDNHGLRVHEFPAAIADYDQTAALVSALDLTISVCTTVVHMAGALGAPVWVLTPSIPEWRYQLRGHGMSWYPSARVWRQNHDGNWKEPIEAAAHALTARLL